MHPKGGESLQLKRYLIDNGKQIGDIIGKVDYSQAQLEGMDVILYPDSVLEIIGREVAKDASQVLFELLSLENKQQIIEVLSTEELAAAIKNQQPYIYITEPTRSENNRLINAVLSEKDRLGLELGSSGGVNILGEILYQFQALFSDESKEFKSLKSKLRHYYVKIHDKSGSVLYEKEAMY